MVKSNDPKHASAGATQAALLERITIEAGKRGGQPCIRNMRMAVSDVLGLLAAGVPVEEVLEDFPDLERDDIRASLAYAAEVDSAVRAS